MRESIGGAWIFQLVIIFILLFTGFLCVAINYNKAFKVKNEVIDYVEREEGLTSRTDSGVRIGGSLELIGAYLQQAGYSSKGYCPDNDETEIVRSWANVAYFSDFTGENDPHEYNWIGIKTLGTGSTSEEAVPGTKYYYCIRKIDDYDKKYTYKAYYKLRLFFKFELPIFGDFTTFSVEGETTQIEYPGDCKTWGTC